MKTERLREIANGLVNKLEEWDEQQNLGPLAHLRRGLSDTTRHFAWPVLGSLLHQLRVHEIPVSHPVLLAVAGCFAMHRVKWPPDADPKKDRKKNFGWTFREVRLAEPKGAEKMRDEKEPHSRFCRLLACGSQEEICGQIQHAIRLAKAREVEVNYRQLLVDLWWWNNCVKADWAKAYWEVPEEPAGFSLAGVGTPVAEDEQPVESEE